MRVAAARDAYSIKSREAHLFTLSPSLHPHQLFGAAGGAGGKALQNMQSELQQWSRFSRYNGYSGTVGSNFYQLPGGGIETLTRK